MSQVLTELLGFCGIIAAFIVFMWLIVRDGRSKK